ncbi:MAG TPA: FtsX-like permease family protein [Thermoplasmata archaeon]|nr:FtsX-like permease family protein [Thermoplasmata archaeon]
MDTLQQLAIVVMAVILAVGAMAFRRPVFARMAIRNISRRKRFVVIVVSGLLIATAMISGSLVVGDTLDYIIKQETFDNTGEVDIVLYATDEAGDMTYFNQSIATDLMSAVDAGVLPHVDKLAPVVREWLPVINPRLNSSSPRVTIFGFDPSNTVNNLLDESGDPVTADSVTNGNAVINSVLAEDLEAVVGDTVIVINATGAPMPFTIALIAQDSGMALWYGDAILFAELSFVQATIGSGPGLINQIDVSNIGGIEDGYLVTDEAVLELKAELPSDVSFEFAEEKKDGIETAEETSDQVSQIFVVMSSFAIIAGVMLIVNIFVMLAEERKPEMGISRAIGMKRADLTQTFLFEGTVYALIASAVGTFVGLLIAGVMVAAFSVVMGGEGLTFAVHFTWESLGVAACAGFLITLATVALASWRVSKLNIVRAIRDIPEPVLAKSEKRYILLGILSAAFGVVLTVLGAQSHQAALTSSGPSLVALGGAMLAVRFVSPRMPFTIAGAFMMFWTLDPLNIQEDLFGAVTGDMEMFIVTGVLLVTGGVIVSIFNSDLLLEGVTKIFGRGGSRLPILKSAISYPMNKKFRTGLSLFMFSLIMFTVVVIAMMASFQRESVDTLTEQFSGGYDVIGMTFRDLPDDEMSSGLDRLSEAIGGPAIDRVSGALIANIDLVREGDNESYQHTLIGFDDVVIEGGGFSLADRSTDYETDADAWSALATDRSIAIVDGSAIPQMYGSFGSLSLDVGQTVTVTAFNGTTVNLTVIGIMDQMFLQGIFISDDFVTELAPSSAKMLHYFSIEDGTGLTNAEVAEQLERVFVEYGMTTIVIRDTIEMVFSMVASIMQLMEIFLGMGLIVGITGLGIITIRNVAERRQEIGVMRAIGYQRDMILKSFVLETSFVSLLGITLGLVLGLALSYQLHSWGGFSEVSPFVIPWFDIILVTVVAFTVTLLSTLPPSRAAARLAPAEALRRID